MVNLCRPRKLRPQGFYGGYDHGKYSMNQNNNSLPTNTPAVSKPANDTGSISVQGFVKIFDPVNKQVFVEKRA